MTSRDVDPSHLVGHENAHGHGDHARGGQRVRHAAAEDRVVGPELDPHLEVGAGLDEAHVGPELDKDSDGGAPRAASLDGRS